jgi:hypothetical protein
MRRHAWLLIPLVMAGCSDSYLFAERAPTVPAVVPTAPATDGVGPDRPAPVTGMTFLLDPAAPLTEEETFDALFTGQAVDPFTVRSKQAEVTIKMKLETQSLNEKLGERYVNLNLELSIDNGDATKLYRQFVVDDRVTLKNVGEVDRMSGLLIPADKSLGEFQIEGQRTASSTEEAARRNPWSGTLSLVRKGKSLRLGTFKGFAEP